MSSQDQTKQTQRPRFGGGPVRLGTDKPKNFSVSLKKLLKTLKPFRVAIILTIIFSAVGTIFTIVSPRLLGDMTNQIVSDFIAIRSGVPGASMQYDVLLQTVGTLIILYGLSVLFSSIQGFIIAGVTNKLVRKYRKQLSEKINRLPIKYFDRHQYGDTLSRITNDVDTIAQSLNQSLSQIITSVTMLVGIVIMMLSISLPLSIVAFFTIPVGFIFVAIITKKTQHHFKDQQNYLGSLNGHIEEVYAGQTIIKAFSGEAKALKKFNYENSKLFTSAWKSQFFSGLMMPIMNFISNIGYVACVVLGGWLAIEGKIRLGDIQAFIQYVSQLNQPMVQVAQIMNVLQTTVAAAERVFDFLEEPEETPDPVDAIVLDKVRGDIEFKNVVFGYEPDKDIIKNFSAKIKAGQKIAIVGPTGAGKTTIVNLLMRFYDPKSGSITIDGVDTRSMTRASVRTNFGMVLQDTWLMHGSILENLKYGDFKADETVVKQAASAAHVSHFVEALPHSYDTRIDEDSEIVSAGEKQLLTIARAMVADAPMMILDEATSSVDTRTEHLIQSAMEKLTLGRTSFIIAHRLSTIREADLIIVMNEGKIVEQGTHKTLLAKNGFYATLYNSQFVEE
jgi:ATP-binding cassette subfamily B protein